MVARIITSNTIIPLANIVNFVIIAKYWSLSITVSTTGFHPVNASSTLAEITTLTKKDPLGPYFFANGNPRPKSGFRVVIT